MIEMKPIIKIQNEYLELLKSYTNLFSKEKVMKSQLAYFFEEIHLFWLERYDMVQFFLNKLEVNDKCSFLAGAMHVDLKGNGHYEFATCGNIHIINEPVLKLSNMYYGDVAIFNQNRLKNYLNTVLTDCINVLTKFPNVFICLPLEEIYIKDQEIKHEYLSSNTFTFVSSLFTEPCESINHFIAKYESIEDIEKDIIPDILDTLIFNDISDISLSLKDRIYKYVENGYCVSNLKSKYCESEIFLMIIGQLFMQSLDIAYLACIYNLIPFVRSHVVYNYLLIIKQNLLEDDNLDQLFEITMISFLYLKIYQTYNFSKIDFHKYYEHVCNSKMIDAVLDKFRAKGKNVMECSINDVSNVIKEECSVFLTL